MSGVALSRLTVMGVLAAALIGATGARAQSHPDAGQTLEGIRPAPRPPPANPAAALPAQENRPALSAPDSKRIYVRRWLITGAHIFTDAQLYPLVQELRGQKLTLAELNGAAARLTAHYRRHGYLLSRAYIPAQDVRDNTVEIAVIEGHLAEIVVTNTSRVAGAVITKQLGPLRSTGPVEGHSLERSLLLLSDLPGVDVHSTLMPGNLVGTSDLDVQVHGTSHLSGSVDADNFGNRYTGEYRGGGTLIVNNPFNHGDQFTLRAGTAGTGMTFGHATWQILSGSGLRFGIAASDLQYRLRGRFASLDAHGNGQVGTLWTAYPLIRSEYANLAIQLTYDQKHLHDRVDSVESNTAKTLGVWTLGMSGNRTDGWGGWGLDSFSLNLVSGHLGLNAAAAVIDAGEGGHRTAGRYEKLVLSYSRTQRITEQVSLNASLAGQLTNKNLDTSETQSLGGAYGIRAYPQDEAPGDDAAVLNLEVRWEVPDVPHVQTIGFVDAGAVRVNHSPLPTDTYNRRYLAGEGFGVRWMGSNRFSLNAWLAWRSGPQPLSDIDRRPRAWIQFVQYF